MMNRATSSVTNFKGHVGTIAPALAGAFSVAGALAVTKEMAQAGAEIEKMARTTGLSAEGIQRMNFAAKQTETSVESLDKSLVKMQRSQVEALKNTSGPQADAFRELNVTIADLQALGPEELFLKMSNGVKDAKDQAVALDAVMTIMGRGGVDTFNMLAQGAEKLRAIMNDSPIISEADVAHLAQLNQQFQQMHANIIAGLAEPLVEVVKFIDLAVIGFFKASRELGNMASTNWFSKKSRDEYYRMQAEIEADYEKQRDRVLNPPPLGKAPTDHTPGEGGQDKTRAASERKRILEDIAKIEERIADQHERQKEISSGDMQQRLQALKEFIANEDQRTIDAQARAAMANGGSLSNDEMTKIAKEQQLKTEEAITEQKRLQAEQDAKKRRYAEEEKALAAEITEMVNRRNLLGETSVQRLLEMQKEYNGLVKESLDLADAGKTKEAREKEREALRVANDMEEALKRPRDPEMRTNQFQRLGSLNTPLTLLPKTDPQLIEIHHEMRNYLKSIDGKIGKASGARTGPATYGGE
jgi:hypothetical protein